CLVGSEMCIRDSWWCWVVAGTLLLVLGIPSLLILGLINKKMWLYPIARFGAALWLRACGAKIKVTGGEDLPPNESFVFISNHRSYLDTATLFFYTGKKIGLVAKKELLKVPILGQGMHYVNIFSIDRSNPERARRSMEKARKVMEKGSSFGVFVEGTRAMPGELLPFKKGAFHLAIQTGARIVPVAIKNTDWMMGKRTGVAFPGIIEMVLLPPVEIEGKEMPELISETREMMAAELAIPGTTVASLPAAANN
ncbi:MAG: lysophospholipid acyltransferase family protein, partial [Pyrinomonadaceae bacterium]|nr:lysophospholipid acyltransferase family protein [Pyrinomonadaceae bacterium]